MSARTNMHKQWYGKGGKAIASIGIRTLRFFLSFASSLPCCSCFTVRIPFSDRVHNV